MNKGQVTGLRGQTRIWSSCIVGTNFFTDCVGNEVTIFNPHLIVGYYNTFGTPLYWGLDFVNPLIYSETIYPIQSSLPFDSENYATTYAYRNFASQNQEVNGVNQDQPPSAPITLSNYELSSGINELFFYWYKTISNDQSALRASNLGNPFLKDSATPDNIGNHGATQINNNFASFSSFNVIDMLDESYCDLSKYFVVNQTNSDLGVIRSLDQGILDDISQYLTNQLYIQIMYLDRGKGFEFSRTLIP